MVAGGVGLAPFATLAEALRARGVRRRRSSTARARAEELFYLDFFRALGVELVLTTEDGSRRRTRTRHRAARSPARPARARRCPVMLYACGPKAMLARLRADWRRTHGRPCQVSVERIMGCGLGGCYSCVVPMRGDDGAFHHVAHPASPARCSTADQIVWDCVVATDMDLSVADRLAHAREPADRGERLLRLRRRVRRRRRSLVARRRRRQRACSSPSAKAIRRRASSRRRPACSTRSACRASACAASSTRSCRSCAARRATVIVNVCGTTLDEYVEVVAHPLGRRRRRRRIELNISCPNIKEGGIQFGCSLHRHLRRRQRGAQGDAAAAHPEADAERHRRRLVRARRRRSRRRRRLARQHVPRDGDRRRDAPAEDLERRRRPERTGDPADRRAHGLRVPPGGEDSDHRHGRDRRRARRARVHDCRRQRGPGRHGELRRSVHLAEAARRPPRLHAAPRHRAPRRTSSARSTRAATAGTAREGSSS